MHAGLLKTLKKVRENLLYSVVLTHFEKKMSLQFPWAFLLFFFKFEKKVVVA